MHREREEDNLKNGGEVKCLKECALALTLEIVGSYVVVICYKAQNVNDPSVGIVIGRDCNFYPSVARPSDCLRVVFRS